MREAGFINITRLNFKMPIGPWAKDKMLREAGVYGYVNLMEEFYGLSVKVFTQLLGWQVEEHGVLLAQCRQELRRKDTHGYWPMRVYLAPSIKRTTDPPSWIMFVQKPPLPVGSTDD